MNKGDTVIYHETNGTEHSATVTSVVSETACNLAFISKGRSREAHNVSFTPGLTGECWKPTGNVIPPEKVITAPGDDQAEIEHEDDAKNEGQSEDPAVD